MTTERRKWYSPKQIARKLRDADAMFTARKDLAAVLQSFEINEATLHRWRAQYGGMKAEELRLASRFHQLRKDAHPRDDQP